MENLWGIWYDREKLEVNTMDMDTLGYFIYMDEMENQQKQQQEDSDDSGADDSN